jgi:hypothetical protein
MNLVLTRRPPARPAAGFVERIVTTLPTPRPARGKHGIAVTPQEWSQRYGHGPAVVVSRSAAVLFALQRALFDRGAAVTVLQALPERVLLLDLLANGLIVLAPPQSAADLRGVTWFAAPVQGSPTESARAVLQQLELQRVLLSRDFVSPGEGI